MGARSRERLIEEVRRHPVLYDGAHEQHRDVDARDRCWRDIAQRLHSDAEVLKREWKILRDSMRQAIRRSKEHLTTKSGEPCKRWRFESRMAFLLPHITVRPRRAPRHQVKVDDQEEHSEPEGPKEGEVWDGGGGGAGAEPAHHESLELFFASVCQSAKLLPRPQRHWLKAQVLEALHRAEEDAAAPTTTPTSPHTEH